MARTVGDGLEFIPLSEQSSQKPRREEKQYLQGVCDEFSRSNSVHPVDYRDLTRHASYTLALIDACLKAK